MQETQVGSLGWEDSLEKGMATHSSNLAWGIPWPKEPGGLQSMGSQRVGHDWVANIHKFQGQCFRVWVQCQSRIFQKYFSVVKIPVYIFAMRNKCIPSFLSSAQNPGNNWKRVLKNSCNS